MRLWLVRHPRPLVEHGVCYGTSDLAVDAEHTTDCARRLAAELPLGLRVWHSPLQRCARLATALQTLRPDLALSADARLAEYDFGCWEGRRWDAIERRHYLAWEADFGDHRFGGRESVNELLQRVLRMRDEVAALGADAAWITHAGVMRAMALLVQGVSRIERADQWPGAAPGWGEWQQLPL